MKSLSNKTIKLSITRKFKFAISNKMLIDNNKSRKTTLYNNNNPCPALNRAFKREWSQQSFDMEHGVRISLPVDRTIYYTASLDGRVWEQRTQFVFGLHHHDGRKSLKIFAIIFADLFPPHISKIQLNPDELNGKWPMNILYSLYYGYGKTFGPNRSTGIIRDAKFAKSK